AVRCSVSVWPNRDLSICDNPRDCPHPRHTCRRLRSHRAQLDGGFEQESLVKATRTLVVWLGLCCLPAVSAFAQRELHWDSLEVTAHLNADGTITVAETQTIVFTGDWNGGERKFNIRPRQSLSLTGVYRGGPSGWRALTRSEERRVGKEGR